MGGGGGGGGEWGEDDSGSMAAGWLGAGDGRPRALGRVSTPGTPGSQWIPSPQDGWGGTKVCVCVCAHVHVYVCAPKL